MSPSLSMHFGYIMTLYKLKQFPYTNFSSDGPFLQLHLIRATTYVCHSLESCCRTAFNGFNICSISGQTITQNFSKDFPKTVTLLKNIVHG